MAPEQGPPPGGDRRGALSEEQGLGGLDISDQRGPPELQPQQQPPPAYGDGSGYEQRPSCEHSPSAAGPPPQGGAHGRYSAGQPASPSPPPDLPSPPRHLPGHGPGRSSSEHSSQPQPPPPSGALTFLLDALHPQAWAE